MKHFLLTNLIFLLLVFTVNAQDNVAVCEDTGDIIEAAGIATACAGSQTGQATVSSTGCSCMFSGCTYEWSDGQTFHTAFNLAAGTYSVMVTHPPDSLGNVCQVTVDINIEDGDDMIESVEQTELSCPDGNDASLTINPSFFAGQLSYQWSTGDTTATVNGLSAGTYAVTVSNFANCIEQMTFEVMASESDLGINSISSSPACGGLSNGNIALGVVGTNNFTVLAVDGDDNEFDDIAALPAGEYEVFVFDENGCSVEIEVTVEEGDLQVELSASSQGTCAGGEVQLSAITEQNATFSWSPADGLDDPTSPTPIASPVETTTYTVTIETPEGCSTVQDLTVEVEGSAAMSFLYNGETNICSGDFMNLVVSVNGATNYTWEPTTGVTGTSAVYLQPSETTTYEVTASLPNGCTVTDEIIITVENCGATVGVDDLEIIENIFPNPSEGIFQVNTIERMEAYTVYTIEGRMIQNENINNTSLDLDLTDQAAGIYFLHISTNKGTVIEKLVKQ